MPTGAPEPATERSDAPDRSLAGDRTDAVGRADAADPGPAEEVLVRRAGHLGHLVLNRPRALNTLTGGMIATVREHLEAWREDDSVAAVLLTGAGKRGLCAGGDVRAIHALHAAGRPEDGDAVFAAEYGMNGIINTYPKPYIALMDGIVLGGGVGIAAHGSHRIVTERTRLGMPETGIGFFPDVGVSHLLARAPFRAGLHLALTGVHVTAGDAIALGLADHFVPSDRLETLLRALETESAEAAIAAVAEEAPRSPLREQRDWIESCYAAGSAEEIVAALRDHGAEAASAAAERILAASPTSVKVALAHVRAAAHQSLPEVLRTDVRLAARLSRAADFAEGVRAVLLDKDRSPRWDPSSLSDVGDDAVEALSAPPPGGDAPLPGLETPVTGTPAETAAL